MPYSFRLMLPFFLFLVAFIVLAKLGEFNIFCIVIPALGYAAVMILAEFGKSARVRDAHMAESNYRRLLGELKQNPTDAVLHQRTLEAGRQYSQLTRDTFWGMLDYDECDLMRDITAATAGVRQGKPEI